MIEYQIHTLHYYQFQYQLYIYLIPDKNWPWTQTISGQGWHESLDKDPISELCWYVKFLEYPIPGPCWCVQKSIPNKD
jgi:hypothetical protein